MTLNGLLKSRLPAYLPIAVLSLVIFLTVDLAYFVRKALAEHFGGNVFNITYLLFALFGLYSVYAVCRSREKVMLRMATLLALVALFVWSLLRLKYGVEKIHYVEYGLLSMLGFNAFSKDFRAPAAGLLSVLLSYFVGMTDEFIQHLSPLRVAEFPDVLLNVKAGLFGACFAIVLRKPSLLGMPLSRKDALGVLTGLLLSVTAAFFFLEYVHGYGFYITGYGGPPFYSSLDVRKLSAIDSALKAGGGTDAVLRATYDNEASRHVFQRDFYLRNKFYYDKDKFYIEYGKAYRENSILEKVYGFYLDSGGVRWDSAAQAFINERQWEDTAWHSRVKETVITAFPALTVRAYFIGLIGLLAAAAIVLWCKHKISHRIQQ